MKNRIKIGITVSESRFGNYPKWIIGEDAGVEIIELNWDKHELVEVWDLVEDCDGIVLTGGVDTHPRFYDNERLDYPNKPEKWNELRDEFEMHVFETALNFNCPVLGICRGHQLINVALGGKLFQDLEEGGNKDHRRHADVDGEHEIKVVENSLLHKIAKTSTGKVNSAHHQGISVLSDELMANSYAPDNVIEGAEWKNKDGNAWLLTVQWHPERMKDREENPFAKNIRDSFLKEVKKNSV